MGTIGYHNPAWTFRPMKTPPAGFSLLLFVGLLAWPISADDYIHDRHGCPNAFGKFAESQKTAAFTKITFFGGSITEGAGASKPENCYRELTMRQLQHDYPGAVLAENNSAIGGTGSWLGAFRTTGDALYGGTALVFVEFAVNDGDAPEQQVYASMEGIVRQIFARDSSTDVVFLYTLVKNHMEAYKQGKQPIAWPGREDRGALWNSECQSRPVCGREDPQGRAYVRRVCQGWRPSDRPWLCHL